MHPKVFVVLVNYNGNKFLEECIISLRHQTYKNCSIILVDNCSTDCSLDILKNYKEVFLIKSKNNIGFAGGCNIGIRAALRLKADYILLLNTDTVAEPDLIEKLLKYADKNTVTTAKIYSDKYKKKIWYAAGYMDFDKGRSYNISRPKNKSSQNETVTFISGCCMLIHRKIWKSVGLMDENYFMYYEDDDLCMRFFKNSINMIYTSETGLWHKIGGSGNGMWNGIKAYYMVRNRLYFLSKYRNSFSIGICQILWETLKENVLCVPKNQKVYKKYVIYGIFDFILKNMNNKRFSKN